MRRFVGFIVLAVTPLVVAGVLRAQGAQTAPSPVPAGLAWAYGIVPPPPAGAAPAAAAPAAAPDNSQKQIPGSTLSFTLAQIRNQFGPADWFPGDHPAMPEIVAKGKMPEVRACSLCHMPNGKGRPENAGVSGLPVAYFTQQMYDFKRDVRKSAEPRKANTNIMIAIAKGMTDQEIVQSAEYFAQIKWAGPWIRVVETKDVPKTRIAGGMYLRVEGEATEPIAGRIIETPEDVEQTEMFRNPRSGFIAYVPQGSIKKGESLVMNGGNGKTIACGVCHGADLKGIGPVPAIAGRSPSYMARQMFDMQNGARHGQWTELMKPVVAKLTPEDFVNILAYVSSRTP
jgi:cytochrome c553